MTITLSPEIAKGLTQAAQRQGTTPEQLALKTLEERFLANEPEERQSEGTAYDLFAGRIGRIQGSKDALSQNTGQRFTEYVVKKHQEGNL